MAAPYEVLAGPFTVYVAATGTAFPLTNAAPSGSWTKLGTTGDMNYDDNGVTIELQPTYSEFTPAGSTSPTKVWRTVEMLKVSFNIVDMTAAQFAKVLGTTQVDTAGPPATSEVPLLLGEAVSLFALLARKTSGGPSGDALASQFQVPIVYNAGQPQIVGKKGDPMKLAVDFKALRDAALGFGKWIYQTA